MTELKQFQHHVIQNLHIAMGLGMIPTVVTQATGADPVLTRGSRCPSQDMEDADIYRLAADAINQAIRVTGVRLITRNTTTVKTGSGPAKASQERVTVRLRMGGITTTNIGATAGDPFLAFLRAYVLALNCLFMALDMPRTVELQGEPAPDWVLVRRGLNQAVETARLAALVSRAQQVAAAG